MVVKKSDAGLHLSAEEQKLLVQVEEFIDSILNKKYLEGGSVEIMFKDLRNGFDGPTMSEKVIKRVLFDYTEAKWKVSRETSHDGPYFLFK